MNEVDYQAGTTTGSQFTIGGVLSKTLSVMGKNAPLYIGLIFLSAIPELIVDVLFPNSQFAKIGFQIVSTIFYLMMQGAVVYGAFQALRGNNASFGECISHGMNRIGPIFGASLITGLCIGLATLAFIIPGIILSCLWVVVIPACVIEKLGATDSMSRSSELTKGFRWPIFALILLVTMGTFLLAFGLGFILMLMTSSEMFSVAVAALICTIPQAFGAVMNAIIYHDLRVVKEGVSVDKIVSVFD